MLATRMYIYLFYVFFCYSAHTSVISGMTWFMFCCSLLVIIGLFFVFCLIVKKRKNKSSVTRLHWAGKVVDANLHRLFTDFSVGKYSVLIMEDEPELLNDLKISLKTHFRQVYVAEEGGEALNIAVHCVPDIVVCDMMMSRMNGFEFCRQLKSTPEVSHIPVILLTARADQGSTIQGYKEGVDFYLPKPFDLEFLLVMICNLLKNREAVKQRYKSDIAVISLKEDTISNADEVFMRKLNELISDQLENPDLDVNYVATQMAMSRASLYNKLKALTDISIGDYINKFRMIRVMELLADKNLSILEVSEKAGFTNQRYFSTVFKQAYGTTPSKYRQEHFS